MVSTMFVYKRAQTQQMGGWTNKHVIFKGVKRNAFDRNADGSY